MPSRRAGQSKGSEQSAFQRLKDQLKWVDLIFEVRDARAPLSSRHPNADQLFATRPRLIILSKEDLADPELTRSWIAGLNHEPGQQAIALALKQSRGKDRLVAEALKLTKEKRESLANKGLLPRPMRACVVGMPNVGKSSLINWLIGKRKTMVGDRPGVTKGPQWVRLHSQLELLDTPGILPPGLFGELVTIRLALLNLLPDNLYDQEETALAGLSLIQVRYPGMLEAYGLDPAGQTPLLEQLASARGCLVAGGKLDTRRAASIFLGDLREGRLGRITLDLPTPA